MNTLKYIVSGLTLISLLFAPTAMAIMPAYEPPTRLPLIRLYNPIINDHFYTSNQAEANTAQSQHGYRIEGTLGYVETSQLSGTRAIIRMWNPKASKHFYTTDSNEALAAQKAGFVNEGTVGYIQHDTAPTTGDQAAPSVETYSSSKFVYRMYNSGLRKHFYTINKTEMMNLQSRGYRLEGNLGSLFSALYDSRRCPDEWIINQMPNFDTRGVNMSKEYFVVNGVRVETSEYNVVWVEQNCGLVKQEVY